MDLSSLTIAQKDMAKALSIPPVPNEVENEGGKALQWYQTLVSNIQNELPRLLEIEAEETRLPAPLRQRTADRKKFLDEMNRNLSDTVVLSTMHSELSTTCKVVVRQAMVLVNLIKLKVHLALFERDQPPAANPRTYHHPLVQAHKDALEALGCLFSTYYSDWAAKAKLKAADGSMGKVMKAVLDFSPRETSFVAYKQSLIAPGALFGSDTSSLDGEVHLALSRELHQQATPDNESELPFEILLKRVQDDDQWLLLQWRAFKTFRTCVETPDAYPYLKERITFNDDESITFKTLPRKRKDSGSVSSSAQAGPSKSKKAKPSN